MEKFIQEFNDFIADLFIMLLFLIGIIILIGMVCLGSVLIIGVIPILVHFGVNIIIAFLIAIPCSVLGILLWKALLQLEEKYLSDFH